LLELEASDPVDLMFMDIDMPQITGIELSKILRAKTKKLVMTTAYTQYGYEAFEVNADAYLLKPYGFSKFAATIAKLLPEHHPQSNEYFFVKEKEQQRLVRINYRDVIAVESKQNYVLIHTASQNVLTYMSLTEITGILMELPGFVKYHRSFVINCGQISSIAGNTLKMSNGLQVTVGESYRNAFVQFLDGKLLKAGHKK
jgi:DNA-binding LytR/AlgR family response regulator